MRVLPITIEISAKNNYSINFKGAELNRLAYKELETVVRPFLDEYKPQTANFLDEVNIQLRKLHTPKLVPDFNPADFKEAKRLRLGVLDANQSELKYLEEKAHKWFSGDVAMAEEIRKSGLFDTPNFLFQAATAYKKLKIDIKNGLKNMTFKKLAPAVSKKKENLERASFNLGFPYLYYSKVFYAGQQLENKIKNNSLSDAAYFTVKKEIEYSINKHKEILPEIKSAVTQAEAIYNESHITSEDEAILSQLHKPAQRVISSNVRRFNHKVQDINLTDKQLKQLDEILEKQKAAIETLWNKIEQSKKTAFAPRTGVSANETEFYEDMPF